MDSSAVAVAPHVGEDGEMVENFIGKLDVENRMAGVDEMLPSSSERDLISSGEGVILEPFEGLEFESEQAAKTFYNAYARHVGFKVRVSTIHRSTRDGSVISRKFVCSKEGFRREKLVNDENRIRRPKAITREGCKAMISVRKENSGKWVVKRFIKEHNHAMVSPGQVQYLRSHRKHSIDAMGAGVCSNLMNSAVGGEFGGVGNVDSIQRDCRNYNGIVRQDNPRRGNTQAILDYLKRMQVDNPAFFYAIQVDEEEHLISFFWTDSRSRTAYYYFGDAVTFDTSYKTKQRTMPLAQFTGVNHHQQSVLFGCALLLDETESSFVWLFKTWLEAMSGCHPTSIITDQDQEIGAAVAQVFPGTRHRFCLWNILRKAPVKLSHLYHAHEKFKDEFYNCIHTTESIDEFESCWGLLVDRYDLKENQWIRSLYDIRHQWVPAFLRDTFFAEMSTTRRSWSLNSFFDGYINSNTTLEEFIKQYARAQNSLFEKEIHADFETIYTQPILKTHSPVEKQAANIYTRTMFTKFQEELFESLGYIAEKTENGGAMTTYKVTKYEDKNKEYMVTLNASETRASCSCQMFEFSGIICRHVLIVFVMENIMTIPPHYILKRWTKNAKSGAVLGHSVGIQDNYQESATLRYNDLCHRAVKFAEEGASSVDTYRVAFNALKKSFEEVASVKRNVVKEHGLSTGNPGASSSFRLES